MPSSRLLKRIRGVVIFNFLWSFVVYVAHRYTGFKSPGSRCHSLLGKLTCFCEISCVVIVCARVRSELAEYDILCVLVKRHDVMSCIAMYCYKMKCNVIQSNVK